MKRVILCLLFAGLLHAATEYSYDAIGRLTKVVYSDGTAVSYTYDSAGNRLSQVVTNPAVPTPRAAVDRASLTLFAIEGQASATEVVLIQNTGGGSLQWNASASVPWLSVTPGSGVNATPISVTASAAGLAPGSYSGDLIIYAAAVNTPLAIPVTLTVTASPERPAINSGGVVSAAGYQGVVARGSVTSLFGSMLASRTEIATGIPLPLTLAGVRVTVNGLDAPLWFVSPSQINFQIPFEAPLTGVVSVVVYRDGVASQAVEVELADYAPGVFTYEREPGVFDPIVTRDDLLISPTNPARPGDVLVVYGTGLGNLTVLPRTGEVTPDLPLASSQAAPSITLGGAPVEVQFSGMTPGAIGLAQFNIKLPEALPPGENLPLVIRFGEVASQPVMLAVLPLDVVEELPDLVVTSFTAPTTGVIGGPLSGMRVEILNQGNAAAGRFRIGFYLSTDPVVSTSDLDTGWFCDAENGLAANAKYACVGEIGIPAGVQPGTYYLGAIADDRGVVTESEENNNNRTGDSGPITLTTQAVAPDLVVTTFRTPVVGTIGQVAPAMRVEVLNQGDARAGSFRIGLYASRKIILSTSDFEHELRSCPVSVGLDPSATFVCAGEFDIPAGISPGTYFLAAFVDDRRQVPESNESNNVITNFFGTIELVAPQSLPDLVVTSFTAPTNGTIGRTISGTRLEVRNQSPTAAGSFRIGYYLSSDAAISTGDIDTQWFCAATNGLAPGASFVCTGEIGIPAGIAAGTLYLGAYVDNQGEVAESNERNNYRVNELGRITVSQ